MAAWIEFEPAVHTDMLGVRLVGRFAVVTERAEPPRSVVVVGEHGPAITVAAERLRRIEACRRVGRKRADLSPVAACTEALRGIGDHQQTVRRGDLANGFIVGGLAVEVDRDDTTGL